MDQVRVAASEEIAEGFPHMSDFTSALPFHPCTSVSPQGHPIVVYSVGPRQLSALSCMEQGQVVELFRHVNESLDAYILQASEETQRLLGRITVVDLKDLKLHQARKAHAAAHRLLRPIVAESRRYYMEQEHWTFVINAPPFAMAFWQVASRWLSARSLARVTFSAKVPEALMQLVGKEALALVGVLAQVGSTEKPSPQPSPRRVQEAL
jgi:hypothetical protein